MHNKHINRESLVETLHLLNNNTYFEFFFYACVVGDLELCQACLDAGADINIKESTYRENLLVALINSNKKVSMNVYRWLVEKGININYFGAAFSALNQACRKGDYELVKFLVENGAEILEYHNKKTNFGSDLGNAVKSNNYRLVKFLLDNGASAQLDDECESPLLRAVMNNNYELTKLLLDYGAKASPTALPSYDYIYNDPIKEAVKNGNVDITELLFSYGANPNYRYSDGQIFYNHGDDVAITYMDIAINNKDEKMQEFLKKYGCLASTKDEKIKEVLNYFDESSEAKRIIKKLI